MIPLRRMKFKKINQMLKNLKVSLNIPSKGLTNVSTARTWAAEKLWGFPTSGWKTSIMYLDHGENKPDWTETSIGKLKMICYKPWYRIKLENLDGKQNDPS